MAVLACIVVACSARLGALDLRFDWYCREACAQNLLVRPLRLTLNSLAAVPSPAWAPAQSNYELARVFTCTVPWQHAATLCRQLWSLHFEAGTAVPDWSPSSPSLTAETRREIDFSDPWTLVER